MVACQQHHPHTLRTHRHTRTDTHTHTHQWRGSDQSRHGCTSAAPPSYPSHTPATQTWSDVCHTSLATLAQTPGSCRVDFETAQAHVPVPQSCQLCFCGGGGGLHTRGGGKGRCSHTVPRLTPLLLLTVTRPTPPSHRTNSSHEHHPSSSYGH